MSEYRTSTCRGRGCHAPIIWAVTEKGKAMPVDADPDDDQGNVELVPNPDPSRQPLAIVHAQRPLTTAPLHLPHHATCPDADSFRRKP